MLPPQDRYNDAQWYDLPIMGLVVMAICGIWILLCDAIAAVAISIIYRPDHNGIYAFLAQIKILSAMPGALLLLLAMIWRGRSLLRLFLGRALLFTPIYFLMAMALNVAMLGVIGALGLDRYIQSNDEQIRMALTSNPIWVTWLGVGFAAPLVEELLFRGVLLREIRRFSPLWVAIGLQAALFGLYHGPNLQAIYTTFFGVLLGWLTVRSGSVWPAVVAHIGFNSFSVALAPSMADSAVAEAERPNTLALLAAILVAGAIVAGCLWIIARTHNTDSELTEVPSPHDPSGPSPSEPLPPPPPPPSRELG